MQKSKNILLCAFALLTLTVFSQKEDYKFNLRTSVNVPKVISSKGFRHTFDGLLNISSSFNYKPFGDFGIGVNYGLTVFNIPAVKIPGLRTELNANDFGLKFSYDKYFRNKAFITYSLNAGMSFNHYTKVECITPQDMTTTYKAPYIEPEISLNFFVEESFGIGFNLSYTMYQRKFNPTEVCLNQFTPSKGPYTTGDLKGNISHINFGIGLYAGIVKRKITESIQQE